MAQADTNHTTARRPPLLFVNPDEYRPAEGRTARQCYVRVAGKHRNAEAAWAAIHDTIDAALN